MWGAPNAKVITCKVMFEEWVAHFKNAFILQVLPNVKHLTKTFYFHYVVLMDKYS